ncbi:hypothetical protein [Petrachloros mirabilis]
MARDVGKEKKSTTDKVVPNDKSRERSRLPNDEKQSTRGWKDVIDNSTYSSGPGDNIYVFG